MAGSAVFWLVTLLTAGFGIVCYLIASDKTRFLARFDLSQWRESYYLRALPNFLQALHDNHFPTPWPSQPHAVAAAYFCYRARPLLKKRSTALRRAFLQQHLILFALLRNLQPFLQDFIFSEQQKIIGQRILKMEDTLDRDRLIDYLELLRQHRARFFNTLTSYDRQTLALIIDRRLLPILRQTHAIYQEHGYSLFAPFSQLRRWDELTGPDLVQELPPLARLKTPVSPAPSH